jgi:beta-lactamase class A
MGTGNNKHFGRLYHILSVRIRAIYVVETVFFVAVITFFITNAIYSSVPIQPIAAQSSHSDNSEYQIKRLANFKFIRPLLSAKPSNEYDGYYRIKRSVADLIQYYKDQGIISSASMYMRDFDKASWTAINQNEKYRPGSILKIPVLMTILRYEEEHPGFLESTMTYSFKFSYADPKKQSILTKQIQYGKSYTRRELLKYMIEYSDNNAGELLWLSMDKNMFARMFEEFGLPKPDLGANEIPLSALDCSVFLESLFNATYLTIKQSEFAIDLLSKSAFDEGIVKGIPSEILLIAHKFGESGTTKNKELHETGVLYIDNRPYLITVMTRGNNNVDYPKLATVIQGISRTIYYGLTKK